MLNQNDKLRTFCPIVLVHDYNKSAHTDVYSKDIEEHKIRVSQMLDCNSQIWKRVKENTRVQKATLLFEIEHSFNKIITAPALEDSIYSHLQEQKVDCNPNPKIKRKRGNLPKATTALLKEWLAQHKKHPYPTEDEKMALARRTNLTLQQISNWFINARRRHLPYLLLEADAISKSLNNSKNNNNGNRHHNNNNLLPSPPSSESDIYSYDPTTRDHSDINLRRSLPRRKLSTTRRKSPHSYRRKISVGC